MLKSNLTWGVIEMKKIGLICATLLAGLSLSACNNMASQQSHKARSASVKVVKHHRAHKKQAQAKKKQANASSVVSHSASQQGTTQNSQNDKQQTASTQGTQEPSSSKGDTNPASNQNYDLSELHKNAQAAIGSDGLMHGRVYGSNGYWIDVDASRQGLADEGLPNSDQDIMNHAETGNAMWNASQNAGQ